MSKFEKRTILLNFIFNIGYNLATNFVSVYLFVYAKSLIIMSIYTIIRIGMFPPFFILGNKLSKKHSLSFTFTIGVILITCSLLYALFGTCLFEINPYFTLGAALITGIGEGFYWYSSNTCNQVVATIESRATFMSYNGIFGNIASVFAPFIANYLLNHSINDMAGYRSILIVIIIAYLSVIFVSFTMSLNGSKDNGSVTKSLSLKDEKWRKHIYGVLFYGLRDSISLTLTGILLFNATSTGALYSKFQMMFSIISVILFRLLTRFLKKENIKKTFTIGSYLRFASAIVLVLVPNMTGAIIYGITNCLASVLFDNSYSYISANIIAEYPNEMSSRVVARECYMSLSRCIGMLVIIMFYLILPEKIYLPVSVILLSTAPFITKSFLTSIYVN